MAPLDAIRDSLDDVPEQYRELYKEDDSGKYRLDVQGVEFPDEVQGLKSALEKERERRKEAEKERAKYESVDIDQYRALLEEREKREEEQAAKRGEFDKLLQKKQSEWEKRLEQERESAQALEAQVLGLIRDNEARKALEQAEANVDLLLPHVLERVNVIAEDDGKRRAVVLNDEGVPRLNDDGDEMSISELVAEMAESDRFRAAFPGKVKSGGGSATTSAGRANSSPFGPDADLDAKVAFISEKGINAYKEALGLQPPPK